MLRRLYDWTMGLAGSRHAPLALAVISFAESSFFPVPPDVVLAPMVLARPQKAWTYAIICTVASVLGGLLGYFIGMHLTGVAQAILAMAGYSGGVEEYQCWFSDAGLWVILVKGLTPIPYKLITIASGIAAYSLPKFIAASVVTRGARFFLVAAVVKRFGPAMLPIIERRLATVGLILISILVLGLVASHFLSPSAPLC